MSPTPAADLRTKYAGLAKTASDLGISNFQIAESGGKLQLTGTAGYELDKNELWNAIKTHGGWENEISANIAVTNTDIHGKYTVKSGDSLSKIAKHFYGDANAYPKIFEANRDILKNPDLIQPGQVLKIPKG
jgi:nucleoid-associated protein YgaU